MRVTKDVATESHTLEILAATQEDDGEYSVVAKNANGSSSAVFSVSVKMNEKKKKPKKKQVKLSGEVDVSEESATLEITGDVKKPEIKEDDQTVEMKVTMETAFEVTDMPKKQPKEGKAAVLEIIDTQDDNQIEEQESGEEFTLAMESTTDTLHTTDTKKTVHQVGTMEEETIVVESLGETTQTASKKPKKEKTAKATMDTVDTVSEVTFEEPLTEKVTTTKSKTVTVESSEGETTISEVREETVTEALEKTSKVTIEADLLATDTIQEPVSEVSETTVVTSESTTISQISEEVVRELAAADEELRGRGPHFEVSPQPMLVNQGDNIRVTCRINGGRICLAAHA